ncbi:MAG: Crp/Fnr family transcriptional regulator [Prosthecobacter sp.]|uniref:Crp/Fnr family transcriptional regulator n=1 Tax=Prosthecobacter sp. TaxID=1965333 RepID=UPI0025E7EAF0|nr:Crp/Fnr family transcriptional regulator [Prosthecobacter sp.]MCF7785527.1 Crp/Fnr family transcriptional regulator [Prosthecobacter sp.]
MNSDEEPPISGAPVPEGRLFALFKQVLGSYSVLKPVDYVHLLSIARFKRLPKGEFIIKAGEYHYDIIIVLKGLLRNYILDEAGEERTMLFVPERKNAGSYRTVLRDQPSVENVLALEDSWIVATDFREFERLAQSSPSLRHYQNLLLKELLASTVDQVWSHVGLSPEQRYLEFCRNFPKLAQRVTQKDLASYLGITPTSLSRIRARIAQS